MERRRKANATSSARELPFALTRRRTGVMVWRSRACSVVLCRGQSSQADEFGESGRTFHRANCCDDIAVPGRVHYRMTSTVGAGCALTASISGSTLALRWRYFGPKRRYESSEVFVSQTLVASCLGP